MYIVNTTFVIEPQVHGQWYEFITAKFIPHLGVEGFEVLVFSRVLHEESTGHYTYSLQVNAPEMADYQKFVSDILSEYSSTATAMFGERALHFTTLLKRIEL